MYISYVHADELMLGTGNYSLPFRRREIREGDTLKFFDLSTLLPPTSS